MPKFVLVQIDFCYCQELTVIKKFVPKFLCHSKIRVNFDYFGYYRNLTEIYWLLPKPNCILVQNRIYRSTETVFTE
jgi:hypothetical protein